MSHFVLVLSIGPVQGFIASARRSRDLWAGSWLLSELAKSVAKTLYESQQVKLVFPYIKENSGLLEEGSDFSVGNKVQAVVEDLSVQELKQLADQAKAAANRRFADIAKEARQNLNKDAAILRELWDEQIHDYTEVQYAWAEIQRDVEQGYLTAVHKASSLLAARKATRDFLPSAARGAYDPKYSLPKSSLDGARETVLPEQFSDGIRRKLGLSQSEQLDCAGVVKRLCGNPEQFTPITRVAAESWLQDIPAEELKPVAECYEYLVKEGMATRVLGNQGIYKKFPYDGQYLYPFRLEADLAREEGKRREYLENLKAALKPIWKGTEQKKGYGEPCPYWVMLLADGDRMGELLDRTIDRTHHEAITAKLSEFAQSVPNIMREENAQCVYSGGDDVLGLVALSDAVKCAEKLKDCFAESLSSVASDLGVDRSKSPTLSVGLAICHINTPLGNVRALAKRAEKTAKGDTYPVHEQRNALGITLAVRSGSTSDMRLRWDDKAGLEAFKYWIQSYSQADESAISSRIAYDCREIHTMTDFPFSDKNLQEKIRQAEFKRMLEKSRTPQGKELGSDLKQALETRLQTLKNLNLLAIELITARWLAAKTQKDIGRENR